MNKIELFRQIGWSDALIEHFVVRDDSDDYGKEELEETAGFVETTTAVISYQMPTNKANVNITIP